MSNEIAEIVEDLRKSGDPTELKWASAIERIRAETIEECARVAKIATLGASTLVSERVQKAILKLKEKP